MYYKPLVHICNTSGIFNFPDAHFDMVRCGIGLYGFSNKLTEDKSLIPVVSLKSSISQIHLINKGDSVGYNRAYIAKTDKKIGTIPLGHADGISRLYGNNNGFVYIKNKKSLDFKKSKRDILRAAREYASFFKAPNQRSTAQFSYEANSALTSTSKIILKT